MQLNLKNPLVFFDLETTGINIVKDRIVEISFVKVYPNGKEESKTRRINPEMPIPPESTAIHGITDEDVKDCPTFKEIAKSLAAQIEGCDLAGYNSNRFDIPLLAEEFLRAGVDIDLNRRKFIDVQTIFHKMEQRTLSAAYKFYCDKSLENAHTAEADTMATYEVLKAQLDRYPELQNDINFLSQYSSYTNNVDFAGRMVYNDKGEEVINFGKYKGRLVEEVLKKCEEADVLDLCTGSGCIGISLGKLGNCKSVTLSDISEGALFTAKENAGRNQVDVTCIQSDLFADIEGTFDVIVSNPPYIESDEILMLMPEVRDYEPRLALDGSVDGLFFYRRIIKEAPKYLKKNGYLFFEIGCEQADAVSGLMEAAGFKEITIKKDYCGRNRIVFGLQTEMVR